MSRIGTIGAMISRALSTVLMLPIRWYQKTISPFTPRRCRYEPTCSAYAIQALKIHGPVKGLVLAIWRVIRCNPWSKGGVDRVPPKGEWPHKPLGYAELMELYAQEDAQISRNNHNNVREEDSGGSASGGSATTAPR